MEFVSQVFVSKLVDIFFKRPGFESMEFSLWKRRDLGITAVPEGSRGSRVRGRASLAGRRLHGLGEDQERSLA